MAERVWRQPHAAALAAAAAAAPAAPAGAPPPPPPDTLVLYNSLVDRKVPFVPSGGPASRAVTWYACGPTVYDSAHVGHARNYVTFDIVRRVLEDYFGYAIFYVMNVTDVDDKIIARARRGHLLAEYEKEAGGDAGRVAADAAAALAAARAAQAAKLAAAAAAAAEAGAEAAAGDAGAARRREGLAEGEAAEALLLAQLDAAAAALDAAAAAADVPALLALAGDALAAHLDATRGAAVTDPEVFRAHAARYEAAFLEDMDALGVRPPTVLTRVSEYVPEIVEYVEKILENGMGYATEGGSVYFDTAAFRAAGHTYGKLAPWAVGSAALAQESGGAAAAAAGGKRAAADFALWKAAKPGEPAWPSPWGAGRPGWHIECSAMASALVGATLDIHSGGEDLRFPHHDNELAQAEARFHCAGCDQWVNYFLHSGHLGVEGLKMSKSLKNFVTIREALETFSPRQLRLMFALAPWDRRIAYGARAREEVRAWEASLKNFFANVEVGLRRGAPGAAAQRWGAAEAALQGALAAAQAAAHARLLDSVDTRGALDAVAELVLAANKYLAARADAAGPPPQAFLLRACAAFATKVLSAMGLAPAAADALGLGDGGGGGGGGAADGRAAGALDALAAFRDEVRALARAGAPPAALLAASDALRDGPMVALGVRLEDLPDGSSVWKPDDPAALRAEFAARRAAAAAAAAKKVRTKAEAARREVDKLEKLAALGSVEAALADKYSRFDAESGDPTHDAAGAPLEGKAADKARKEAEKQRKARAPLAKRLAEEGPGALDALRAAAAALEGELAALELGGAGA